MKLLLQALVVVSLVQFAYCLYGPNSGVVQLNIKNFAHNVLASDSVWVVEFFAPWCGHCKSLAPQYEKAAASLKGLVKVGAVDCDDKSNQPLCGQYGIQGFPTIKVFPSEQSGKGKVAQKKPVDYQGARTAAAIAQFALGQLPSTYVTTVSSKNHQTFLSGDQAKVLLFTDKPQTTPLYKSLSLDFKGRLVFGEVKHTEKELVKQYSVKNFPTLLVIKGQEQKTFEGKLDHASLEKFLSEFAGAKKASSHTSEKTEEPVEDVKPVALKVVHAKDQATFEEACKTFMCLIAFLEIPEGSDKPEQSYLDTLTAVQDKFKTQYQVVWLEGQKNVRLAETLELTNGFPSAALFSQKKSLFSPFLGSFNAKPISDFLDRSLRSSKRLYPLAKPLALDSELPPAAPKAEEL